MRSKLFFHRGREMSSEPLLDRTEFTCLLTSIICFAIIYLQFIELQNSFRTVRIRLPKGVFSRVWQCIFSTEPHIFPSSGDCGISGTSVTLDKLLLFQLRFQDEDKASFRLQVAFGVWCPLLEEQESGRFQRHRDWLKQREWSALGVGGLEGGTC